MPVRRVQGRHLPIGPGVHPEPERNGDVIQPKTATLWPPGSLCFGKCPSPAAPTRPDLYRTGMSKESTKVTEAFGLSFQQYCARIEHFALPHNVDRTRNCHKQTAPQRLVGENAYRTVSTIH
jgi:hypothetical protein